MEDSRMPGNGGLSLILRRLRGYLVGSTTDDEANIRGTVKISREVRVTGDSIV